MDLGSLAVRARLRGRWEALDLGFLMARAWWWRLYWSWFLPSTALLLVLNALSGFAHVAWCALAVWWLKPLWDRLPLHIASRALFGEHLGVRDALRSLPALAAKDILPWLSWRRFSLTRSFDLPVTVLEGLRGARRRQRLDVLRQHAGDAASWLTITCFGLELALLTTAAILLQMLLPERYDLPLAELYQQHTLVTSAVISMLFHLAATVVAPFYATSGFALYISRRIELEGWDVEIRFRHLADREQRARNAGGALAAVLLVALLCAVPGASPRAAPGAFESGTPAELDAAGAHARVEEVLAGEDFHDFKTVSGWRWRTRPQNEETDVPGWLDRLLEWLAGFDFGDPQAVWQAFARALEFVLWACFVLGGAWLALRYRTVVRRLAAGIGSGEHSGTKAPTEMFGLDLRAASLPDDVAGAVLEAWRSGQSRQALSLLYRATLSRLVNRFGVRLAPRHTESECVHIVAASVPGAPAACFRELTAIWQRIAYAHRLPAGEEVEALLVRWRQAFDVAP